MKLAVQDEHFEQPSKSGRNIAPANPYEALLNKFDLLNVIKEKNHKTAIDIVCAGTSLLSSVSLPLIAEAVTGLQKLPAPAVVASVLLAGAGAYFSKKAVDQGFKVQRAGELMALQVPANRTRISDTFCTEQ